MKKQHYLACGLLVLLSLTAHAGVRLPKLLGDGMVLQRDTHVRIWGWADKNEKIHIHFIDEIYSCTANDHGEWEIHTKKLESGGPYQMTISAGDTVEIKDILVGDVWVCSGQSNMKYRLSASRSIYEKEIAQSANSRIRCFTVPEVFNFIEPQKDLESGEWLEATPENVLDFSAVAYFFAAELYKKYGVPIGLIHSSWGGSRVEAWMSIEAIKEFPDYYEEALKFGEPFLVEKIQAEEKLREETWFETANAKDAGFKSPGTWFDPETNTASWDTMKVPGYIARQPVGNTRGVFWFHKEIDIPADMAGKEAVFKMGAIVNSDSVYINGVFVGATGHQWTPRIYDIPEEVLKAGKNTIVLRLVNHNGYGGFQEGYPCHILIGEQTIDISGEWKYHLGAEMDELPWATSFNWKATGLYNGMAAPLTNYTMKGVIWYQGEGNASKPEEYEALFPTMINNWRKDWGQGDFPFLFVQLANFMKPSEYPGPSNWAMLRDSQRKALRLPNTGMAVAIDIGVAYDVHPMNKKDVGYRLALEAQRVAYHDKKVVSAGPSYISKNIRGDKIILSFETYGSKLKVRNGEELAHFAIAGGDNKFVWADATIIRNKVVVSHPGIAKPLAVRYAWADNPETANLVNSEGLPASPFRTDE